MSFPYEFYENFEAGTLGNFDSESDAGNRLDFPHARDLAPHTPFRGAYCARVNLGKNSTDAYLEEAVSWSTGEDHWGRFRLFVGEDVQFGNDLDNVILFQFLAGTTPETWIALGRHDAFGGLVLRPVQASNSTWWPNVGVLNVPRSKWITVEFNVFVHATNGSTTAIIPDCGSAAVGTGSTGSTPKIRVGALSQTGDIQGTLLIDDIAIDQERFYDDEDSARNGALSGRTMHLVKSGFAFLGPGFIEHVSLVDGGSGDCRIKVYDADTAGFTPAGALRESLATTAANTTIQSLHAGFSVHRGAYVELSGTNPQAIVRLGAVAAG